MGLTGSPLVTSLDPAVKGTEKQLAGLPPIKCEVGSGSHPNLWFPCLLQSLTPNNLGWVKILFPFLASLEWARVKTLLLFSGILGMLFYRKRLA